MQQNLPRSLPSSAEQNCEMTKFRVAWRMWTTIPMATLLVFIHVSYIQFRDSFGGDKQTKWLKGTVRFVGKV